MARELVATALAAEERLELAGHLAAVADGEEIVGREEAFGVAPRRAHERDAAGERFERADGGDAGEGFDVRTARDVDGELETGEDCGDFEIGEPAAVGDAGVGEGGEGVLRVADAVDAGFEAEGFDGAEEEFLEFVGAFVVAPVADPDEVAFGRGRFDGAEEAGVGGFVPSPGAIDDALAEVEIAEDVAVGENAVVVPEIIRAHAGAVGDEPVVGVVEEGDEVVTAAGVADAFDELGGVPLVDDDEVGVFDGFVEIEGCGVVGDAFEEWIGGVEASDGIFAVFFAEVFDAPGVGGFVDEDLVSARDELRGVTAEEVGVAVIPVGDQRVVEKADFHAKEAVNAAAWRRVGVSSEA